MLKQSIIQGFLVQIVGIKTVFIAYVKCVENDITSERVKNNLQTSNIIESTYIHSIKMVFLTCVKIVTVTRKMVKNSL